MRTRSRRLGEANSGLRTVFARNLLALLASSLSHGVTRWGVTLSPGTPGKECAVDPDGAAAPAEAVSLPLEEVDEDASASPLDASLLPQDLPAPAALYGRSFPLHLPVRRFQNPAYILFQTLLI